MKPNWKRNEKRKAKWVSCSCSLRWRENHLQHLWQQRERWRRRRSQRTCLLSHSSHPHPYTSSFPPILSLGLTRGPQIDPILPAGCGNLRCERVGMAWALHCTSHHHCWFFFSPVNAWQQPTVPAKRKESDAAAQNFILSVGLYGLVDGNIRQRRRKKKMKGIYGRLMEPVCIQLLDLLSPSAPPASPFLFAGMICLVYSPSISRGCV